MADRDSESSARKRSRLTLGTGSSNRKLPLTANIPQFTHPSSQQSNSQTFKSLPRPIKEKVDPKPKPPSKKKASSILTGLKVTGFPGALKKEQLEKAEAERKKREGPLDEAEEGHYDDRGFWIRDSDVDEYRLGVRDEEVEGEL